MSDNSISDFVADTIIERPIGFSMKRKHFRIFPASLGKMQLVGKVFSTIGLTSEVLRKNSYVAILNAAEKNRDVCLRLCSYITLPGNDCLNENLVKRRVWELSSATKEDIASLINAFLMQDRTTEIERHFKMDIEEKRLRKAAKLKCGDKNTLTFGGKSVWGALIDAACERYGWSLQYVVWGISYSNLKLMIDDQIRSIYLTDKELKNSRMSTDNEVVRADNTEELLKFIKKQDWR